MTAGTQALPTAHRLRRDHRDGWALPGYAYTSPELFHTELRDVFGGSWLFLGPASALPEGHRQAWAVGTESVIVSRDSAGVHGYANVCAHRGSRLLDDEQLHGAPRLACPYHSWAYHLDGSLAGAPHMGPGFHVEDHRLTPLRVRDVAGLLFVHLDADPARAVDAEMDRVSADITPHLEPYRLHRTTVAARESYRVAANWKTITENNRECYHCRANHPEFCLTNYEFGTEGDPRSTRAYAREMAAQTAGWVEQGLPTRTVNFPGGAAHRAARLPLKPGCVTESLSGRRLAPLLGTVGEASGSVRLILMPNLWAHVNCDYAMLTRLTPRTPMSTDVDVTYLVAETAVAGRDYDPAALTAVWAATSQQDWELSERNQLGQASRAYRPGPLSPITETSVGVFHAWYLDRLAGAARA